MTYGLGMLVDDGLVMASDSRTNAGVDQIGSVCKMSMFHRPGDRAVCILSAGNLGTTQAVVSELEQAAGGGVVGQDLYASNTLYDVAAVIGARLRTVVGRDGPHVRPFGDPNATFLVGGRIQGRRPRLFLVYSAGNFVEAGARTPFLQIGETKYGKPILDRLVGGGTSLGDATKIALLSFDATLRSNLSVGLPIDLLEMPAARVDDLRRTTITEEDPYWASLTRAYSEGLAGLIGGLPGPSAV